MHESSAEITATANPSNGGTVSGAGNYCLDETCTLTATAATGYNFANWSKSGTIVSSNASYSFTVNESGEYTANFVPVNYSITATASPSVGGMVIGAGSYNYGTTCTLTASPANGYAFVQWSENGSPVSTSATYSFEVTGPRNLTAVFELSNHWVPIGGTQYNMTVNGYITIDGVEQMTNTLEVGAFCGDECRGSSCAMFFPPTQQYIVSHTIVSNVQSGETITFRLFDHGSGQQLNHSCLNNITFEADATIGLPGSWFVFAFSQEVTITATASVGGTVTGAGNYAIGASCTLTATPNPGYTFQNWTENGTVVSTDAAYGFTVTEPRTLVANFSLNSYEINTSASPVEGGSVTGSGTYNHFDNCTLTANANAGYTFVNWTENGNPVSTDVAYSFTVTGPRTLAANFSLNSYSVTVVADPVEGGTITGAGTYAHGANVTLTATANAGYTFVNWTKDGFLVSTSPTYSFSVTEPGSYAAHFTFNSYEVLTGSNPEAGGAVTGGGTYNYGETAILTATANVGYTFVNWVKDGTVVSTEASYTFTVTEAGEYVANFALNNYEVTATADPAEGGTITGTGVYAHGTTATLTATPEQGYAFSHWTNDYELEYLTIESLVDNNTVILTIPSGVTSEEMTSVSYSFDKTSWTTTAIDDDDQTVSVTLNASEKVYWKGIGSTMAIGTDEDSHSSFSSDGAFKVYGNAMSLFHGDDFVGKTNDNDYYMAGLFYESEVVDAFNLALPITTANSCYRNLFYGCSELESAPLLPATTLSEYCYAYMFKNCTSLVKSPTLPAATLDRNSYYQMFYGCSALNEVTCLATDISASNCLTNWVRNVASTGTFRKALGMIDWTTGSNGIPSDWTVEEVSAALPAEAVVTFTVTEPMHYVAHFSALFTSQEVTLAQGWNWWAPTVAATLQDLETALGVNGQAIMAEDGSTLNYANGQWNGTLESLALGQMYRINTSSPCEFTLTGAKPASVEVSLAHGAHWFGFTGSAPTAVGTVFGTAFGPVAGDKVVSQNGGFAIYNGTAWQGTLTTLLPGQGYVYVSQSNETKTLVME